MKNNRAELRRSKRQQPISQENAQKLKKFNLTQSFILILHTKNYTQTSAHTIYYRIFQDLAILLQHFVIVNQN